MPPRDNDLSAARRAYEDGNYLEALGLCKSILERRPSDVEALALMGELCRLAGDAVAAIGFLRAALRASPEHPRARRSLGELTKSFDRDAARDMYMSVLQHDPTFAFHDNQEIMLSPSPVLEPAIERFRQAAAADPALAEAHAALGNALFRARDFEGALAAYGRSVHLVPEFADAHLGIWRRAVFLRDERLANEHLSRALAIRRVYTEEAHESNRRRSILVVYGARDLLANVATDYILHPALNTVHKLYLLPGDPPPPPAALPPFDMIFNAIGESPLLSESLNTVQRLIAAADKPFINDPVRVPLTCRDTIVDALSEIADCRIPKTIRLDRGAVTAATAAELAQPGGFSIPFLIRPVGSHSGEFLGLMSSDDELRAYGAEVGAQAFYLSEFVDYRSPDGFYRKYRVIMVDGRPYPYHLAISPQWMVHYFSAPMREHEWMRAEEARFLAEFVPFDEGIIDTLESIARRIGLDYFGIDCALTPEGDLLVFEIDAASLVHLGDPPDLFGYKHEYVPRIIGAVERMLIERQRPAQPPGQTPRPMP